MYYNENDVTITEQSSQGHRSYKLRCESGQWKVIAEWEEAARIMGGIMGDGVGLALDQPHRFDEVVLEEDREYSRSSTPEGSLRRYQQTKGWLPYDPAADL